MKKSLKSIVDEFEDKLDELCESLPYEKFLKVLEAVGKLLDECREGHGFRYKWMR